MSLTPKKYDLNDASFEGFPDLDRPDVALDGSNAIELDLPLVTDSEEKLHFFVVDKTLQGPDVYLV